MVSCFLPAVGAHRQFIEVADEEAARKVFEYRQNSLMPGEPLTGALQTTSDNYIRSALSAQRRGELNVG